MVSLETLRRLEAAVPVATYTCQGCRMAEEPDVRLDPIGERWVCDGCFSDVEDAPEAQGPAVYISALPRLLAAPPGGAD